MTPRALFILVVPFPALAQTPAPPPPATAPETAAAPAPAPVTATAPVTASAPAAAPAPAPVPAPASASVPAPVSAPVSDSASASDSVSSSSTPPHPLRLSFTSTSAFGFRNAGFFNQLVGVRLDYRFSQRFAFGGALSYANLKGKDDRVHNVLPEAVLEYRVPLAGEGFGVPLRFATGFLPQNGPTLRVSAGLDFRLSDSLSLEAIPLEPMAWVNRERPEVSMNGTLSLRIAF